MSQTDPRVDAYVHRAKTWQEEIVRLRAVILGTELTEELKWGKPCYTYDGGNVVIIAPFKPHCALLFCRGALIRDPRRLLIAPTQNTQAARQMRFISVEQIVQLEPVLRAYLVEAIAIQKAGDQVEFKASTGFTFAEELQAKLDELPDFKAAFEALTPGRQRGYNLYFSAPKQSATRSARIVKCVARILEGKGMHDR